MSVRQGRATVCVFLILLATGCSTITDTLGLSPPAHQLLKDAKEIRDTAPVPAPSGRELAKELLPTYIVQQGDSLLVQTADLDSPIRLPSDQTVQPDGTIDLGKYGRPVAVGKTLQQIEMQVNELIRVQEKQFGGITIRLVGRPNSVFYVFGEVNAPGSFPTTGRETVLDGIVAAGGLSKKASADNIILSRPTAPDSCRIVFPVCWRQIVQLGDTTTNYQLLPGDRIYVPSKGSFESFLQKKGQEVCPACQRPEVSCFGGVCAPSCSYSGIILPQSGPARNP
jgi:polysaccharide export outer membrane protein